MLNDNQTKVAKSESPIAKPELPQVVLRGIIVNTYIASQPQQMV